MPYASFDLYLRNVPAIPQGYEKIPSRPSTLVYRTPNHPTTLTVAALHLLADHIHHRADKGFVSKQVTIPANSVLQFSLDTDRESSKVVRLSVVPDAGDGKPLWMFYWFL